MLRDSAKIQSYDIEYLNKKRKRKKLPPVEPIYEMKDVVNSLEAVYRHWLRTALSGYARCLYLTFYDAGTYIRLCHRRVGY